jgi:FAD:protein FMN transferase
MRLLACSAALLLALGSCDDSPEVLRIAGETMGTTYHVTIVEPPGDLEADGAYAIVGDTLDEVNESMSNWDPASEVSRFNARRSTEPVKVSDDLAAVIRTADMIHVLSGGRYDVTLAPLIDLWGFGPEHRDDAVPSAAEIARAREDVGQGRLLDLRAGAMLAKRRPGVTINLSSIAKGYGIDAVARALEARGVERYLVEIGGDLVAAGLNAEGKPWSIGIERPDAGTEGIEQIVPVRDMGMATSGDYRNFFEKDGVRYSHILDPLTGRPISHRTASVTVFAENATLADGLATALLAVGADDGLGIAEENGIAAMFIDHDGDDFVIRSSSRFEKVAEAG